MIEITRDGENIKVNIDTSVLTLKGVITPDHEFVPDWIENKKRGKDGCNSCEQGRKKHGD